MEAPVWFGPMLAIARHKDSMNRWNRLQRWLHKTFIACPCCESIYGKDIRKWYRKFGVK